MPIVHVNVWEGFGPKKAKTVIREITKVFADLGIPAPAVEVIVHEIQKSHWGSAGSLLRRSSKISLRTDPNSGPIAKALPLAWD